MISKFKYMFYLNVEGGLKAAAHNPNVSAEKQQESLDKASKIHEECTGNPLKETIEKESKERTSPENALSSVSTLIVGNKEAMVVDLPFLNSAECDPISFIKKKTHLPGTKVFSTHEHPDHFSGGTELLKVFLAQWTPAYGKQEIPQSSTLPKPYERTIIRLKGDDNEPTHLLQPLQGDVDDLTVLWVPSQKTVITVDLVYAGNEHIWLTEAEAPINRDNWISSLTFLQSLKQQRVIGGHVPSEVQPKVSDLLATKDYVSYFNTEIFGKSSSGKEIYAKMSAKFPTLQSIITLNITTQTYGRDSN
ncbi:hypothetical protein K7432_005444 [Basidiobolus ranarum]|uniref:Metallo-beta-lactamase domain-containing protein n=1 Tax=Basidiobolus ranarum TaxID=34480 RepID=A0ABR2W416_9FUNG